MLCFLVVLVKLSVLAKWLARKTPLRKLNHREGIISRKPRPKSAHDFFWFIVLLLLFYYVFMLSPAPYMIYFPTVMARYSLFVLKVPLNPKETNMYHISPYDERCSPVVANVYWLLCTSKLQRTMQNSERRKRRLDERKKLRRDENERKKKI